MTTNPTTTTTLSCPACPAGTALVAVDRRGVTIDACPRCRGVWLDRGELDKLIELEAPPDQDFLDEVSGSPKERGREAPSRHGHGDSSKHGSKSYGSRKKRSGLLSDIFDFG